MNDTGIRRILVALDASEPNRGALQVATLLASQLHAELHALFVEDANLVRLAELPFAREMIYGSREGRRITPANMERQMAAQATRLRQLVEATALQNQIKADFKILRGQISRELCLAAQQMDLLILSKSTQSLHQSLKLGKVAQDVLATANSNLLLLQYGARIERPVAVLFDGSEVSQRALEFSIQLAHGDHDQLTVIYPAVDSKRLHELQTQVENQCRPPGIDTGQVRLNSNTSAALLQALTRYNSRVLVVEAMTDEFKPEDIKTLIQQSHIPVIVMR